MRFSDMAIGAVLVGLGAAVALYARTFPPMPGQDIGPALFPTVVGAAFVLLGLTLFLPAFISRRDVQHVVFDDWTRRPRMTANGILVIADLLFYAAAVDVLGFLPTAVIFLSVLWLAFGVRRRWIAPLAVAVTLVFHYGFYTVLHVPLPWGVLEQVAW